MFSDAAKEQANRIISEIHNQFKKDVFVEAYTKPPDDKKSEWDKNKSSPSNRKRFFEVWAEQRFRALGS